MVQSQFGPAVTAAAVAAAAAVLLLHVRRRRAVVQQVELVQLNLRELPKDSVPAELLVETYVDLDKAASRGYAHVDYLRASFDVCAVLDGLHAYTVEYLQRAIGERDRGAAMLTLYITKKGRLIRADTYGPARASAGGEWATQGCSGRVVIEVGARFHPERLIGGTEAASPGAPEATLYVCSGALVQGGVFDLSCGSIWLGAGALVEPGVLVRGPAVVGAGTVLRHGAYIRGDVVLGAHGVFGGELKGVLALDHAELPHTGYCGDSLLGHRAHFGCGAVTANFPLFTGSRPALTLRGARYDLGRRKLGAVLGDHCQLGCGSVTEPGCLLAPNTHAYPLSRLPRGVYGPRELLKSRPRIERAPLR